MTESVTIQDRWTNPIEVLNTFSEEGNPSGGSVKGVGLEINWQDGPLKYDYENDTRVDKPNGAFTQDVVLALINRLNFFQTANEGKFRSRENAIAITHLEEALLWMQKRQDDRVARKVQGEYKS